MLAVGHVESLVVGNYEYAASHPESQPMKPLPRWGIGHSDQMHAPRSRQAVDCSGLQLAVDYMGSQVVVVSTVAGVREQRGVRSCFAACVLLCTLVAALRP